MLSFVGVVMMLIGLVGAPIGFRGMTNDRTMDHPLGPIVAIGGFVVLLLCVALIAGGAWILYST